MTGKPVDRDLLKQFTPLNGLKPDNQKELAAKTSLQSLEKGRYLFKQGDNDDRTLYLLQGEIELKKDDKVVHVIKAGSDEARHPVAPKVPRHLSARAKTDVQFLPIDSNLLDIMLTWDQTGQFEVSELHEEEDVQADDWMTAIFQTPAFHKVPPANIQAMFMRMEPVKKQKGESVIQQGEDGDYFYIVTEGKCQVTRETPTNKDGIKLAELGVGDTFGEEALISDAKRNATITMLTDGNLMRLAKNDFKELLNEPILKWVTYDEAKEIVADGGGWIDVRLPSEFENNQMENAVNIPLYFLRMKLDKLDKDKKYVVYCDTGRRSSAAAYILEEKGFNAYVLKGGISSVGAG